MLPTYCPLDHLTRHTPTQRCSVLEFYTCWTLDGVTIWTSTIPSSSGSGSDGPHSSWDLLDSQAGEYIRPCPSHFLLSVPRTVVVGICASLLTCPFTAPTLLRTVFTATYYTSLQALGISHPGNTPTSEHEHFGSSNPGFHGSRLRSASERRVGQSLVSLFNI